MRAIDSVPQLDWTQISVQDWGLVDYQTAWARQKDLVTQRQNDQIQDTFIFCHHPEVITVGRKSQRQSENVVIRNQSIPILHIERGGEVTYHGPGQLVIYPIFKLSTQKSATRLGVVELIRWLEQIVIDWLKADFSLDAGRVHDSTGVWIAGERKIASIGIAASRWVSYHGLALNLSTGSEPWTWINPCGFSSQVMTDLQQESGHLLPYEKAVNAFHSSLKHKAPKEINVKA